jgi:hypothetical protein
MAQVPVSAANACFQVRFGSTLRPFVRIQIQLQKMPAGAKSFSIGKRSENLKFWV